MNATAKRGFTLIELLVVVAIIALLIAILLPSLGKARTLAKRTQCAACLKGWGVSVYTYAQEYNDIFGSKIGSGSQSQWDQDPGLYGAQSSRVLSQKLKYCPADPRLSITNASYGDRPLPSYKFIRFQPPQSNVSFWRLTQFKTPSSKLLMCDSNSENNFGDLVGIIRKDGPQSGLFDQLVNKGAPAAPRSTGWDTERELLERHGGTGAVLFLDGHVGIHTWKDYLANIPSGTANDPLDVTRNWTKLAN